MTKRDVCPVPLGDHETAADFIETTRQYVRWGDGQVEAGELSVEEQSRRIRAALADALWWVENRTAKRYLRARQGATKDESGESGSGG